jgi:hypothetical protein
MADTKAGPIDTKRTFHAAIINAHCFKSLNFGVLYYAAIAN